MAGLCAVAGRGGGVMKSKCKFGMYDVLVDDDGFRIIQVLAMSEYDAVNIVRIKGYTVLDVAESL